MCINCQSNKTQICSNSNCGKEKPLICTKFQWMKRSNKFSRRCRECDKEYYKNWRSKPENKIKQANMASDWYLRNKKHSNEQSSTNYQNNKGLYNERSRNWYKNNKEYASTKQKERRDTNKELYNSKDRERYRIDKGLPPDADLSSDSSYELIIKKFLTENSINFESQKIFDDCKNKDVLPFDFYLPGYNLLIEIDGPQHFKPIWGIERLNRQIKHDKIKDEYAENNNIRLLRIPYWEESNILKLLKSSIIS